GTLADGPRTWLASATPGLPGVDLGVPGGSRRGPGVTRPLPRATRPLPGVSRPLPRETTPLPRVTRPPPRETTALPRRGGGDVHAQAQRLEPDDVARSGGALARGAVRVVRVLPGGVPHELPALGLAARGGPQTRERHVDRIESPGKHDEHVGVARLRGGAQHLERPDARVVPRPVVQRSAAGVEPRQVGHRRRAGALAAAGRRAGPRAGPRADFPTSPRAGCRTSSRTSPRTGNRTAGAVRRRRARAAGEERVGAQRGVLAPQREEV